MYATLRNVAMGTIYLLKVRFDFQVVLVDDLPLNFCFICSLTPRGVRLHCRAMFDVFYYADF